MSTQVHSYNMASSNSDISSIMPDSGNEKNEKESDNVGNIQNSNIRTLTVTYSQHATNDSTSSPLHTDIPQWKKDLIQRRKTNPAKTAAAPSIDTGNAKAFMSTSTADALSPTTDLNHSLPMKKTQINYDKPMNHAFNANIPYDTKIYTSQQITPTTNVNNKLKMPATPLQQDEIELSCGGHYTQVNNKSNVNSNNHNEKLAARTFIKQQEQSTVSEARSLGTLEYNRSAGEPCLVQENASARLRKNLTQQHETTNTNTFDSLSTSTSRLSLKVSAAEAENLKKMNKDTLIVCVGEKQTHTIQEPALISVANNNNSSPSGSDGDPLLHQQLKTEHESDSLFCASVNNKLVKEVDLKTFLKSIDSTGIITCSSANLLNKKTCGVVSVPCKSSTVQPSQFVKNPNVNSSTLLSSHHNYKIQAKLRLNQNTSPSLVASASEISPAIEPSTSVTNNKKKMVAAQEMSEVATNELDFDSTEELQYGPGIVSKLRCRYLSLALRQSMDKQRLSIDTLRRATSLNNLLDENDVNDEEEDDCENFNANNNKEVISPTSICIQKIKNKTTLAKSNEKRVNLETNTQSQPSERVTSMALTHSYQYRSRNIKRGNDSLKRARSVEALLSEKSPWHFPNSQPINSNNANIHLVSIEDKIVNARGRLLLGVDNSPKRLSSIIDDTERPPPDLVKQTLKKFEASANRRSRALNRNVGGEVAMKVANYKSIITQNKPAITFPKPPVSPKNANLKQLHSEVKKNVPTLPIMPNTPNLFQEEINSNPLSSTPTTVDNTTEAYRKKMEFTPIKTSGCVGNIECLSEYSPDIIPRHKFADKSLPTSIAVDSPVTDLTKKIENLCIESPVTAHSAQQPPFNKGSPSNLSANSSDRDSDDEDSMDGEYVVNSEDNNSTKQISKSALENIARAGTSQHFLFKVKTQALKCNFETNTNNAEPLHDIPTLQVTGSTNVRQIGVIKPLFTETLAADESPIRYIEQNPKTPILTSREIEKNRINNEKKNEKENTNLMDELKCTGFAKAKKNFVSSTLTNKEDETLQSPVWQTANVMKKKRNPSGNVPENNTMVFNFKDRKEVPDYIENNGLIFKRKRELPKPNEPGFVLLGDLSLETSTDPEDEWPMCPPSPCDVEFENANIIIDGKSSIKNRPKDINARVQFNDTLTSTFEYPSESSLIDDSGSEYADASHSVLDVPGFTPGNRLHNTNSPAVHHHIIVEEIIQLPHSNKPLGNLSLGSAPLNNYTPVKAKIDSAFQLGVTRVPNPTDKSGDDAHLENTVPDVCNEELEGSSLDYLKPATDDLTIAYSEGSLKTDLLY